MSQKKAHADARAFSNEKGEENHSSPAIGAPAGTSAIMTPAASNASS
jgi:hypothetical protein